MLGWFEINGKPYRREMTPDEHQEMIDRERQERLEYAAYSDRMRNAGISDAHGRGICRPDTCPLCR